MPGHADTERSLKHTAAQLPESGNWAAVFAGTAAQDFLRVNTRWSMMKTSSSEPMTILVHHELSVPS